MSDSTADRKLGFGATDPRILNRLAELLADGQPAVLATVVATSRSVPRQPGAKMLIVGDGRRIGTVGGGEMEARVEAEARTALADGRTRLLNYRLVDPDDGDPGVCGGEVTIHLEPHMPPATVVVIGCGHVGRAVADLARWLGYRVVASDDRPEVAEDFSDADLVVLGSITELLGQVNLTSRDHAIVVTRNTDLDVVNLPHLLATEVGTIGVMGSKRRWETTRTSLEESGVDGTDLDRVVSPVGIDVGAETPEEIAVSIMAQIVEADRGTDT
ncbi:MAG: XdhC family protein [Actinomycetota bacterium]|nr:XdhC family protein [Actinomycetota bacterium]